MQTNKYRPVIPVVPVLTQWLATEYASFDRLDREARKGGGHLANYFDRSVLDVDRAWSTMLTA